MTSTSFRPRWLALLLALVLVAAACGSDDGDTEAADDGSASETETTEEADTDEEESSDDEAMADDGDEDAGVAPGDTITIGFSVQSISRTFFSGMLAGIEGAEAEMEEKYGVNISIVTTTAQDESSIQDENTGDLIAAGVDGVIFSPVNSGAATSMVDRLIEADIDVVAVANQIGDVETYGRNTIYPGTAGYVTNDDIAMGAKAAEAADALAADVDGTANIFILQGTQGAANVPLRQDGFTERLAELGTDWNQLDARPGDFSNVVAEETCQNAITAFPEMHIIYSMSDEMTAGCVRALESADRLDIGIASIGGNAKGIELLEQGLMPATVCQKPGTMGATALDSLLDAIVNGNERGLEFYETPVVTLDNLDDCVPQW
ncbi:MAG: sugar ABC transporter substrate-binding protein [Actinomycetota bacterium]